MTLDSLLPNVPEKDYIKSKICSSFCMDEESINSFSQKDIRFARKVQAEIKKYL